jgi:hypothetical protein
MQRITEHFHPLKDECKLVHSSKLFLFIIKFKFWKQKDVPSINYYLSPRRRLVKNLSKLKIDHFVH